MLNQHEIKFLASLLGHHTTGVMPKGHPIETIFEYAASYCERHGIEYDPLPLVLDSENALYGERVLFKLKDESDDK
jgi:hypothetical protein